MTYFGAGGIGCVTGALVGGALGVPLMLFGPGAGDPFSVLWVFFGAFIAALAGAFVGLALRWGTPRRRIVAGSYARPVVLGALATAAIALAFFRAEVLDEWFNLPIFAAMGAATGALLSRVLAAAPPPRRRHPPRSADPTGTP